MSNTNGIGNAGDINIEAENEVNLVNSTILSEVTEGLGMGNGGDITIKTGSLLLQDGSALLADTENIGNAGSINIEASNRLILSGEGLSAFPNSTDIVPSQISATVDDFVGVMGSAGDINISTPSLTVKDNGFISANTFGNGNAGNLTIKTEQLLLERGGELDAISFGNGNAGNLTINALESIKVTGTTANGQSSSGIFASAFNGSGNGGNLAINTDKLIVEDRGIVAVSNFQILFGQGVALPPGTGEPGNITIQANSINLENNARIDAATQSEIGDGANITLNVADDITLENNSFISARALNNADGGNLNIDTNFIVAFPNQNNDIIANAQQGNGGNINITAESVFGIEERALNNFTNDINATSALGAQFDGNVAITIPDINAIQTETQVPNNLIESQQTTEQACQSDRINAAKNGLNILGKGGIPPQPIEPLQADNIIIDSKFAANYIPPEIEPIETDNGDIYPARGIIKTADGGIILTAYPTENIPTRTPIVKPNCN